MFGARRFSKRREYDSTFPSLKQPKPLKSTNSEVSQPVVSPQNPDRGYLIADLDEEEVKKIEQSKVENGEIEILCNGIRFKGRSCNELVLPQLICEECEKVQSSVKCEECDQVFCVTCYSMCHERLEGGTVLHPHEVEKMVRPVRFGDSSSVIIDSSFVMPNYEFYENDMDKIRPLEKPHTLALSDTVESEVITACNPLKYQRGDIVLYQDAVLNCEVYGKVESEWDLRNGDSAPALLRSAGVGLSCYIVRCHGVVTADILKQLEDTGDGADSPTKTTSSRRLPVLEGVECMTLTSERVLANRIDKKLHRAKYYREFGPKHHLNPPIPRGFGGADGDDESLGAMDSDSDHDSVSELPPPTAHSQGKSKIKLSSRQSLEQLPSLQSTRPPTAEEIRAKSLPHPIASRRGIDGVIAAYSYVAEKEASLQHRVYDITLEAPLLQRRNMISIQSEDTLITPKERLRLQKLRRHERIQRILTKRMAALSSNWLRFAFQIW